MRSKYFLFLAVSLITLVCQGCVKRQSGKIDVDLVQTQVDAIETHLRDMKTALRKKDIDDAQDQYDEAVEIMEDYKLQLAAYPEVGLLKQRVIKARSDLCYGSVNIRLESFFDAIRRSDSDQARSSLGRSQEEFKRCSELIKKRDDFIALKMNIESAPQALRDVRFRAEKADQLKEIKIIKEEIANDLAAMREKQKNFIKQPSKSKLVYELRKEIQLVRDRLKKYKEYEIIPDWTSFVKETSLELLRLNKETSNTFRRGKIERLVAEIIPQADLLVSNSKKTHDKKKALNLLIHATKNYRICQDVFDDLVGKDPLIVKHRFVFRSRKKSVAWLKRYCDRELRVTEKIIQTRSADKQESYKKKTPIVNRKTKKLRKKKKIKVDRW